MKYTHAIVVKVPNTIKFEDKKAGSKIQLPLARRQQDELNDTLKEAGVEVIELPEEENTTPLSLFADNAAIVINGTALIACPKKPNPNIPKIQSILKNLAWHIVEAPQQEHGKPVVLEGSDVLFTGREIFVGIRKNGTNFEGALVVARVFSDTSVISIPISGNFPLKHYISAAANDILTVSKGKESQSILRKIERNATFRYKVLTLQDDESVNCINVNDHLIFRLDCQDVKFRVLQEPLELWGVTGGELIKIGAPLSKFCLLIEQIKPK